MLERRALDTEAECTYGLDDLVLVHGTDATREVLNSFMSARDVADWADPDLVDDLRRLVASLDCVLPGVNPVEWLLRELGTW